MADFISDEFVDTEIAEDDDSSIYLSSETRLFLKNSRNEQILFGESTLSVKRIRCLGGDRHDHVYLWQEFSPTWLNNHGILPNPNTQSSRNPTADQLRRRKNRLESWQREIERLEREARAYCM